MSISQHVDEETLLLTKRVFDVSPDHISVLGTDYRYRRVNPAYEKAHGLPLKKIIGFHVADLLGQETFEQVAKHKLDQCLAGETVIYEDWFEFASIGVRYMMVTYTPLLLDDGRVDGVVVVSRDSTELKIAELKGVKLEHALDHAMEGIGLHDENGIFTYVNSAEAAIYGYEPHELLGKSWKEQYDAEQISQIEEEVIPFLQTQGKWNGPLIGRKKTGELFDVEVSLTLLKEKDGCIKGLLCTCRDITERKLAEEALQESETRLQSILDNSPGLIFLKDLKGRYLHVNRQFKQVFQLTNKAILGYTDDEVFSAEQATHFTKHDRQVMESQKLLEFEEVAMQEDGLHTSIVHKFPLFNHKGEMFAVGGITTDITERKKMEEQLRETQNFSTSIIENIPNMVFVKDAKNLRFVRVNKAGESLVGYSREDLIGKNDYDFFPKEEANFFTAYDRKVLESGTLVDIAEEPIHTSQNGTRILHTKKIPLCDEKGEPQFLLGISEDITDRKRAREDLRQSQQAYEDLVNSIEGIVWECEFPSYRFTFVSQQAERLLGYPIQQWIEEPDFFGKHLHPEDQERALGYCFRETIQKRDHEVEYRMIASDGHVVWLRDLVTVVIEDDQPIKVRGVMFDITERKHAEEALEESRKRFQTIFQSAGIGMALVDNDGHFIETNLSLEKFLGYTQEELKNKSFVDVTFKEDIGGNLEFFHELKIGTRNSYTMAKRYVRKDDQVVWGHLTVTSIRRVSGEFEYAIAMIEDITEKKQSEHKLEKWATIFQNTQWGIAVSLGDSSDFELVNKAYARMHGYSVKELIGKPVAQVFAPEFKSQLPRFIQKIHDQGYLSFEATHIRKDGSTFPALVTVSAIKDSMGIVLYRVANVIDISDRKNAEEALRTSESTLKSFFDSAPLMMGIVELENDDIRHISDNSATGSFWGCDVSIMKDQLASGLGVPVEIRKIWINHYRDCQMRGVPSQFEYEHKSEGGNKWLSATVTLINNSPTSIPRFAYVIEDITDRKRMEDELRRYADGLEAEVSRRTQRIYELEQRRMQVEKLAALAQVAAGVAHEINNPLASISQSMLLLKGAISPQHSNFHYVGKIDECIERIAHIVKQLYQLYRPEPKLTDPIDLISVVRAVIDIMTPSASKKKVFIQSELPEGRLLAKISRVDLTQVLCNLLQNAIDVSPPQGSIVMKVVQAPDSTAFHIQDHGPGIVSAIRAHIFEPFFTTKQGSPEGGMGLGLAVSRSLVVSMGGNLDYFPNPAGGTIFRVKFSRE